MSSIYWSIADRNPYIALQCKEYTRRHDKAAFRRWWYLIKALCRNRGCCHGKIIDLEEVFQVIDRFDVISFDIFDTLLVRPYERPVNLFFELEKRQKAEGFGRARIAAEQRARERHPDLEDITLDHIYQEIDDVFRDLKEKELALEEEVLAVNLPVYEMYQYALKKEKRIIICSDMYLPKDFLESVLYKKGYGGFFDIFVSSDHMLTKSSGNLYKYVLKELNIGSDSMLHIGDNLESDGNANRLYGIAYVCVHESMFVRIGSKNI